MILRACTLAFACTLAACASNIKSFEPTERVDAISPQGYTAALYDLDVGEERLGEVKVWTRGIYRTEVRGIDQTVVHVGLAVENQRGEPIRIPVQRLYLDSVMLERQTVKNIAPSQVVGDLTVAPGTLNEIDAYFVLPPGVNPGDVDAFRIHWGLRDNGRLYTQITPFIQQRMPEYAAYYPYYYPGFYYSPFYDPFYDPFYPGYINIHDRPFIRYYRY